MSTSFETIPPQNAIGLKGRVKVSVIGARGETVLERPWRRNLLLDQGMNNLGADIALADLFKYAAKGTGTTATKETVDPANSFTLAGSVLTRSAGTRDFVAGDVGALVRRADTPFTECIITSIIGVTSVNVRAVGQTSLANYTAKDIILYSVQQTALVAESADGRTNTYGAGTDENKTTDASNVRTLRRTFVFEPEAEAEEDIADTNTYSRALAVVTRTAGTRDFTADDVGKYLYFDTAGTMTKITVFTNATHVTVADSGTIAAQTCKLYGFFTYGEIGFSNLGTIAANLNIRVRLEDGSGNSDPVVVEGSNPENPGQQLKIQYELEITATPATSQAGTAAITDSGNVMSASKAGHYCIEALSLSRVDNDGETNLDYALLEPAVAGNVALSPSTAAIVPLAGPDRSAGADSVALEAEVYVADSFTRTYEGTFGLNAAIGTNWRVMGIYDVDSETFPFVFTFTSNQAKDTDHTLSLRFRKTWNRDLS